MKIKINKIDCKGCGACAAVAPELFEIDDEGKAILLKKENLTDEDKEKIAEAADTCPVQAISVKE